MQKEQCFLLGRITKLHGYKGAMVLYIDSFNPQYFGEIESVFLEFNRELIPFFFTERGKLKGKKLIIKLEDVSAEEASRFVGCSAYLPEKMLPVPKEGFYDKAILGYTAYQGNKAIGSITDVVENSAQNLFIIEQREKEYLIPAVEAFIQRIEHPEKIVYLELPEGLLDL